MEPDIEDEFAETQPVRTRPVSRQQAEDIDELADEPVDPGLREAAAGYSDSPAPAPADAEEPAPSDGDDPYLLFPDDWDKKADENDELVEPEGPPDSALITQDWLRTAYSLKKQAMLLERRYRAHRASLLDVLGRGAVIEPGEYGVTVREEEPWYFRSQAIVAAFGEEGLARLKAVAEPARHPWLIIKKSRRRNR